MKRIITLLFLIVVTTQLFSQKKTDAMLFGDVKCKGKHIPYVNIIVKGTTIGTATDKTGHYRLVNLPVGKIIIRAQAIGYKPQEKEVVMKRNKTTELYFNLEEDRIMTEQVVVTANRNEISRKEAPIVVNVMSKRTLDAIQASSVGDGLNFQPGVRVENDCQNCGFSQVRINGLEGPYSQILINSRPIFSALNGVYGLEQIPANMIERVEVVRGGGSALFGANAIGGTINIITRDPVDNSFTIGSNLSFIDMKKLDRNINFNTSVVNEDHNSGISVFGVSRDRQYYDSDGDGYSEIPKLENNSFGFNTYYKPTFYSKITLDFNSINEFRRGGNKFDLQPHETNITEQTKHKIINSGLTYLIMSKDYKTKFSVYTSAQSTKRNSYYGADFDLNAYGRSTDLSIVNGMQLTKTFDSFLSYPSVLTAGLENQIDNVTDKMPGYNRDFKQDVNIYGAFLQNEWKTDNLNFLLGFRVDKNNKLDKPVFIPRANILYKPNDKLQMRLSYAKGYRAPQAFDEDLHIEAVNGNVMLIQLADGLLPEHSNSLSSSIDYYHSFGDVQFNILSEIFYTQLSDVFVLQEIGTDALGNMIVERSNGSGSVVKGVNIESKIAFSKKIDFQFGFTLQKSQYNEPEAWSDDTTLATTRNIMRAPDRYGYFVANYKMSKNFKAALSGTYTGPMYTPHFSGYIANDLIVKTKDFYDIGVNLSYKINIYDDYSIVINTGVKNILNSYQSDFDKGANRDAGYVYGPLLPRTVFIGIKLGNLL